MTLLKSNSLEFLRFRIRYEFARIQIESEANLHPYYTVVFCPHTHPPLPPVG